MKRVIVTTAVASIVALAAGLVPRVAEAQLLNRLSVATDYFADEISTTEEAVGGGGGGVVVYTKTLFVPNRTVYVTILGAGHAEGGITHFFSCRVDGAPCTNAPTSATQLVGWVALQAHEGVPEAAASKAPLANGDAIGQDLRANPIAYSWCASVAAKQTHTIQIRMASEDGATPVSLEAATFIIDSSAGKCVSAEVF